MRIRAATFLWLKWPLIALAALVTLLFVAVIGTAALLEAGFLHEPVRRLLVARTQREIHALGPVRMHLFSLHPSLTAERVVIDNPPWSPAGILAEIGRISLALELPTVAEPLRFRRLELQSAAFYLLRDEAGNANWRSSPGRVGGHGSPLIGSLSVPDARVHLNDARRHLIFEGKVSAIGVGAESLRVDVAGRLNTRPMTLAMVADALMNVRRDRPYSFHFEERSSGSSLSGRGALAMPFDLRRLEATLEASGNDAKDLYFLVGLNVPDTGPYRLSGVLQRSGLLFTYTHVQGKTGESDVTGTVHVDATGPRTQVSAELESLLLRRQDLGPRAAGRAPERDEHSLLLPDEPIVVDGLRRVDSTISYRASSVLLGRLKLNTLVARVRVDHGVLTAAPVTARIVDGTLNGRLKFDASKSLIATQVGLEVDSLQLAQFRRGEDHPPALEGLLRARLQLAGTGHSLHELAASANGTIAAVLPGGTIRSSLAELAGLDFRALGLLLAGKQQVTPVRCGMVSLKAHDGTLTSDAIVLDTVPVLITGSGTVHLDTEALDFQFHGHPKHVRLRLRTSLVAQGTLARPTFALRADSSLAQAGIGLAVGTLLTPLAAGAAFVDLGRTRDADCTALIAANGG